MADDFSLEGARALQHRAETAEETTRQLAEENERLRAFFGGPAPEWEKANATLKHRVRELEAALAWYADPANYKFGVVEEVRVGDRARTALEPTKGERR